ncbi:MAG: TIGR03790 family protein [Planctomycetota bacterium]|nr:MAG: TIGR03790 family protein [Planctomycetota bacterium]
MLCLLLALAPAALPQDFDPDPEHIAHRVLVVYNANWPDHNGDGVGDSEEVARHHAARRGIPERNLFPVYCSVSGASYDGLAGWQACWDEVIQPLRDHLTLNYGPWDILGFSFCHGVPYQINSPGGGERSLDESLIRLWQLGDRDHPPFAGVGSPDNYFDGAPTLGPDVGRFNPKLFVYFGERNYLVARLDGADAARSKELVDFALYADAYLVPQPGYYTGTAYCDTQYGLYTDQDLANYPFGHNSYANADKDMAYGRRWLEQAGFVTRWEPYDAEIGMPGAVFSDGSSAATAPQALWYHGWYNLLTYHDAWEWLPGSAACDLDSLSIYNLRSAAPGSFLGEAFRRGLTASVGVLAEPFLDGHCYPESFTYYLVAKGYTFAEAARVSDPRTLWRNLYVGDFLYQPTRAGKAALLDTQQPPPAAVTVSAGSTPDERVFQTTLDTAGSLPDVGRLTLHYGPTPAYGFAVAGEDDRPRVYHSARVGGLGPDELLHFRADYTDPAGNTGAGTDLILHTALATQPVLARVVAPSTVAAGQSFEMEIVLGAQAGFATLTSYSVTITSAVLGWSQRDVLPLILGLVPRFFNAADGTLRSARCTVPGTLPPDTYLIEASATSGAGSDSHAVTLTVQ